MTNEEKFNHPRVTNIQVGDIDEGWSSNFLKALENVKTKYVIIILDDYILNKQVDEKKLDEVLKFMRKTNGAYIQVGPEGVNDGPAASGIEGVTVRSRFGAYRTSLQACIWETEVLKWLLKPGETIWEFEKTGSIRSEGVMKKPFYLMVKDPIFEYLNAVDSRKYRKKVVEYINEQGIKFDPQKLPIYDEENS